MTNPQLPAPQVEKTDRIQMKDFNDMTATLDGALHSMPSAPEAAQAAGGQRGRRATWRSPRWKTKAFFVS